MKACGSPGGPQALADLRALRDALPVTTRMPPRSMARRIRSVITQREMFPAQGRPGRRQGTREPIVSDTPYFVVYRVRAGTVRILRIMHGRQRWP